ncbi:MAG: ATP-binding cassette domain-containing protein, partial [Thermoanaerobaculia bacterium]
MSASASRSLRPLETRPALLRSAVSGAAAPLLSVRALTIAVPGPSGGEVPAVDGVSFDIETGEIVALVGESGCGKTLTSLALVDLVPPPVRLVSGDV